MAWTLVVFAGAAVNAWTCREALCDLRIVKGDGGGWRWRVRMVRARQSVRDELVTLIFQVAILIVRMVSLFGPGPTNPAFLPYWIGEETTLTLLQVLLAYNCILDLRDRRRATSLLAAQEGGNGMEKDPCEI